MVIPGVVTWNSENKKFKVVEIDPGAFRTNAEIASVVIPESVKEISSWAFENCTLLNTIKIGKMVKEIGQGAFSGCASLKKFEVDDGNKWFSADEEGVLFNVTKDRIMIYPGAKQGDYELPDGVTSMGKHIFYGHPYITGLTIPGSIKKISDYVAGLCSKLERFTMLEGVETVGITVTDGCKNLKSIHVPSSTKKIEKYAFTHCKGPVYWLPGATECKVDDVAFGEKDKGEDEGVKGKILYVRKGMKDKFTNLSWVNETAFEVKEGCVVTFKGNGGMPEKIELMVGSGEKVLELRGPRKAGCKFLGWREVGKKDFFILARKL